MRSLALLSLLAIAGCYSPDITDGQFLCKKGECPSGFVCSCGGVCVSEDKGAGSCDMGAGGNDLSVPGDLAAADLATRDLAGVSTTGCSNGGGQRVPMGDPGLADLAFCAAAWREPGTSTATSMTTPCNRQPDMNGMNGTTKCTVEDNCAAGWHVCENEMELATRGLTRNSCAAAAPPSGTGPFFVTRQGNVPMPVDMDVSFGCGAQANAGPVLGCGSAGPATAGTCTLLAHVLVNPPNQTDNCSTLTDGAFSCAGANMSSPESTLLIKPGLMGGGVLCCRD